MDQTPRFVAVPSEDREFGKQIRTVTQLLDGNPPDEYVAVLLRELRPRYPGLEIRSQHSLASLTSEPVFYVYRDGDGLGSHVPAQEPRVADGATR